MFRFKSIIVVLALISCTPIQEECIDPEHDHHIEVVSKTDSILSYADTKINKIKQHQVEQRVFVDSLRYEIYTEQTTINNINRELNRKIDVEKNLELTRQELEVALSECKKKEKQLIELNEKFALKSEKFIDEIEHYIDREIKLITSYSHKIDSLKQVIELLNQTPNIGKKDKRKNKKNK
tara:strand:+ start:1011 stop:1550 length:540 start_codon:yes stop_codon:yes gene_type:complete